MQPLGHYYASNVDAVEADASLATALGDRIVALAAPPHALYALAAAVDASPALLFHSAHEASTSEAVTASCSSRNGGARTRCTEWRCIVVVVECGYEACTLMVGLMTDMGHGDG